MADTTGLSLGSINVCWTPWGGDSQEGESTGLAES